MVESSVSSDAVIAVDRALRELRAGLPVWLAHGAERHLVQAAEYTPILPEFLRAEAWLALPFERLAALGWPATQTMRLEVPADSTQVEAWVNPLSRPDAETLTSAKAKAQKADSVDDAALKLLKFAELLPAAYCLPEQQVPRQVATNAATRWLTVTTQDIQAYDATLLSRMERVSEAVIPLHDLGRVRVVSFRPRHGGLEHLAILTGELAEREPLPGATVPVRLHSSCLTGDVLGSMRCDCGEQLRKAIRESSEQGGGVVLYLNQEGRGVGIANKLMAYRLQDLGHDTYDANRLLGFGDDERRYGMAGVMLKSLGINKIVLMTNNPDKLNAMKAMGLTVVSRKPHAVAANASNAAYLEAKKKKRGHRFEAD